MLAVFLQRGQQADVPVRVLVHRAPRRTQRAFRGIKITRFAEKKTKALQGECRDAVPGRHGLIRERLAAVDELFVIVCGKPESAVFDILEMLE